jgi:hypothetical protein
MSSLCSSDTQDTRDNFVRVAGFDIGIVHLGSSVVRLNVAKPFLFWRQGPVGIREPVKVQAPCSIVDLLDTTNAINALYDQRACYTHAQTPDDVVESASCGLFLPNTQMNDVWCDDIRLYGRADTHGTEVMRGRLAYMASKAARVPVSDVHSEMHRGGYAQTLIAPSYKNVAVSKLDSVVVMALISNFLDAVWDERYATCDVFAIEQQPVVQSKTGLLEHYLMIELRRRAPGKIVYVVAATRRVEFVGLAMLRPLFLDKALLSGHALMKRVKAYRKAAMLWAKTANAIDDMGCGVSTHQALVDADADHSVKKLRIRKSKCSLTERSYYHNKENGVQASLSYLMRVDYPGYLRICHIASELDKLDDVCDGYTLAMIACMDVTEAIINLKGRPKDTKAPSSKRKRS